MTPPVARSNPTAPTPMYTYVIASTDDVLDCELLPCWLVIFVVLKPWSGASIIGLPYESVFGTKIGLPNKSFDWRYFTWGIENLSIIFCADASWIGFAIVHLIALSSTCASSPKETCCVVYMGTFHVEMFNLLITWPLNEKKKHVKKEENSKLSSYLETEINAIKSPGGTSYLKLLHYQYFIHNACKFSKRYKWISIKSKDNRFIFRALSFIETYNIHIKSHLLPTKKRLHFYSNVRAYIIMHSHIALTYWWRWKLYAGMNWKKSYCHNS